MSTNPSSSAGTPAAPGPREALLEHGDRLRRLARSLVLDDGEAEDVLHDAWIAARGRAVPAGVPAGAWMAGFVRNAARGRRRTEGRRRARERDAARGEALPSAVDDAERLEIHRALLDRVEALPEAQRRVIVARFLEGHPPRRIAKDEGVPVATVHSRIQRGLAQLRTDLDAAHGDRRTWAAWVAPVAGLPRWTRASLAGAFAGAAALVTAVAVATVALRESTKPPPPIATVTANGAAPVAVAPVAQVADEIDTPVEPDRTARSAAPTKPLVVRVVRENGAPAAGVDVFSISTADVAEHMDAEALSLRSSEGVLHDFGERAVTDDDGVVEIDLVPPAALWAGDDRAATQAAVQPGTREITLTLSRAPRLTVRILDDDGEPMMSGLDVGMRTHATWKGSEGEHERQRRNLVDGRAFIQDVTSFVTYPGAGDEVVRHRAKLVYVDVPGCAESGRGAKKLSFRMGGRIGKPRTVDLELPPLGSVQIVVREGSGIARVDGTVSLRFPGGDGSGAWPLDYYAALADGIAVFPRFAVGAGAFRAQISIPERGANWQIDGTSPSGAGKRVRLSTSIPVGQRVEVVALDVDGTPMANTDLYLALGVSETGGMYSSRNGRTDRSGHAVFMLTDRDCRLFPMRIEAHGAARTTWTRAAVLFESAETRDDSVIDLGEATLEFLAPRTISGRVVDADGRPVPKLRISVLGEALHGASMETRKDGTFETREVVRDEARIAIKGWDGWRKSITVVPADELHEPIVVVAQRASSLEADLDLSPFEFRDGPMNVVVFDESGEAIRSGSVDATGHLLVGGLDPGTYDVGLRMRGRVPLVTIPGVSIPESGVARDPRLDAFRLRDHVREIEVVATGLGRRQEPQMSVDALTGTEKPSVHLTDTDEPFLVPLHIPCRLTFTANPKAPVVVADSTTVEDRLEIAFADPKRVTLRLVGKISPNETLTLIGVTGTPTQRCRISVDPANAAGGRLTVSLPAEGRYRVARAERPSPAGGGMMMMPMPQPTEATVELQGDATVDVPVDAPPLPR
ncbi:MAG: RNA polymerase sigma factor [Planctomycetota bacterium]